MGAPVVSICIPAFNAARYVASAVESALRQSFRDLEVVIVDDASDDGTFEILSQCADPRVRLFRNPRRLGHAHNRNRSVDLAAGSLVKFLDHDDILEPSCVAEMVEVFRRDSRVGFVFCRRRVLLQDETSELGKLVAEGYANLHLAFRALADVNPGSDLLEQWIASGMRGNWIGEPSVVMVARGLFERSTGFSDRIYQNLDVDLWMRLLGRTHVGFIDKELVHYRTGHESASHTNYATGRAWLDRLWMLEHLAAALPPGSDPRVSAALRAERRAAWRTVAKLGLALDRKRVPVVQYGRYVVHRAHAQLRSSRARLVTEPEANRVNGRL